MPRRSMLNLGHGPTSEDRRDPSAGCTELGQGDIIADIIRTSGGDIVARGPGARCGALGDPRAA